MDIDRRSIGIGVGFLIISSHLQPLGVLAQGGRGWMSIAAPKGSYDKIADALKEWSDSPIVKNGLPAVQFTSGIFSTVGFFIHYTKRVRPIKNLRKSTKSSTKSMHSPPRFLT
jgi:hypothetical protein